MLSKNNLIEEKLQQPPVATPDESKVKEKYIIDMDLNIEESKNTFSYKVKLLRKKEIDCHNIERNQKDYIGSHQKCLSIPETQRIMRDLSWMINDFVTTMSPIDIHFCIKKNNKNWVDVKKENITFRDTKDIFFESTRYLIISEIAIIEISKRLEVLKEKVAHPSFWTSHSGQLAKKESEIKVLTHIKREYSENKSEGIIKCIAKSQAMFPDEYSDIMSKSCLSSRNKTLTLLLSALDYIPAAYLRLPLPDYIPQEERCKMGSKLS